jgi:hypothetical protein
MVHAKMRSKTLAEIGRAPQLFSDPGYLITDIGRIAYQPGAL